METKKAWDWIKEHKKEILITTGTIVGAGVLGYFGVGSFNNRNSNGIMINLDNIKSGNILPSDNNWRENPIAKLDHVTIADTWKENDYWNEAIIDNFTAADMGVVGEKLMANIPEIKPDTVLGAVLDIPTLTEAE